MSFYIVRAEHRTLLRMMALYQNAVVWAAAISTNRHSVMLQQISTSRSSSRKPRCLERYSRLLTSFLRCVSVPTSPGATAGSAERTAAKEGVTVALKGSAAPGAWKQR